MRYENVIFDLDGTLTESRSAAKPDIVPLFERLCRIYTVVIMSGADVGQMKKQMPFDALWKRGVNAYLMAQNGNVCILHNEEKWRHVLPQSDKLAILEHIRALREKFPCGITDESDLVDDRGGQISFSFIGHNADGAKKRAFDVSGLLRAETLEKVPFISATIAVKIGGTTSLDYVPIHGTKADNALRLLGKERLKKTLFIGDRLDEGGNDEVMRDACDCVATPGPKETKKIIAHLIQGSALKGILPVRKS